MNKTIFFYLAIIFLFTGNLYSQNKVKSTTYHHVYMNQKDFYKKYTSKDSIGFLVKDNDTLIEVKNYKRPKGTFVPYEYKDSLFLELYKKIAFQPSNKNPNNSRPMKYWKGDIKIYFSNSISKKVSKESMKFIKKIDFAIDSLNIKKVNTPEKANFIIYHNTDYQYESQLDKEVGANYWVYWNKKNQINKGFIRIYKPSLFSDKLELQKIKEQFVLSLGWFLPNKELSCTSYFSNCYSDNKVLTEKDMELLKYHYSYGICKGTTRKTFEDQHRRAKEATKNTNSRFDFFHEN